MRTTRLVSRIKSLTLIGISGLLVLVMALPPGAPAQTAKRKRSPQARRTLAIARQSRASATTPATEGEPTTIDVLSGMRSGQLSATATGKGDGRITLRLANKTNTKLRVVLPPGLVVSGATGQFGGGMMGGMGGGMMGGMGGGMMGGGMGGGMMGGMGGMGGGMGGMGGGMMGGMGRMGMGGGTMPSMMGMMMLSRLIMYLAGDYDSWDQRSLMIGMGGMRGMGGMGGGMMGGMGGGMGGMGMMGGMMSVPPTGPLETTLQPHQERSLPTTVVSMNPPTASSMPRAPAEGETLRVGSIDQLTSDKRTITALKRLAQAKAPRTIAQMVFWYVTSGADWNDVGRLSQGWGNASELALARRFVADLGTEQQMSSRPKADPGLLFWEIKGEGSAERELTDGVRDLWTRYPVLGLTAQQGVPEQPDVPALACRAEITDGLINVKLSASHPSGSDWILVDRFQLKRSTLETTPDQAPNEPSLTPQQTRQWRSARLALAITEAMAERLVHVKLARGPRVHGKESFQIKIINDSPFILNGLAIDGAKAAEPHVPSILAGLSLAPLKALTVPASVDVVKRLGLKEGARVVATDLSGL